MRILNCCYCGKPFEVTRRQYIWKRSEKRRKDKNYYCSYECRIDARGFLASKEIICTECGSKFSRCGGHVNDGNNFCSSSCAAIYNNRNKSKGTRRSKLEVWIEESIASKFCELEILYNDKSAIGSELDIYIPSIKLAFEINGIFHYEPVFGNDKLKSIQENDALKIALCGKANIRLITIDASRLEYFNVQDAEPFLQIVIDSVNRRLSGADHEEVL